MSFFTKIRKCILLPCRLTRYGKFGVHSDIINPFLINGHKHIYIGDRTIIRDFARIEAINTSSYIVNDMNQGDNNTQKFSPKLEIGNHVMIEQGVHITCSSSLVIGDNVTISSYVYISDTSHSFGRDRMSVLDQPLKNSPVKIEDGVFVGTGVKILPGVSIGENSVIGANAVVTHDIPANSVAVGVPAVVIKRFNVE